MSARPDVADTPDDDLVRVAPLVGVAAGIGIFSGVVGRGETRGFPRTKTPPSVLVDYFVLPSYDDRLLAASRSPDRLQVSISRRSRVRSRHVGHSLSSSQHGQFIEEVSRVGSHRMHRRVGNT